MTRRAALELALTMGLVALLVQPGAGQEAKLVHVRGYVVQVTSPTEFTLDANDIVDKRSYRVNVAEVPESRRPRKQLYVRLTLKHFPWLGDAETTLSWPSTTSVSFALGADSGPWFATVTVTAVEVV